jgi:hypothetical protein
VRAATLVAYYNSNSSKDNSSSNILSKSSGSGTVRKLTIKAYYHADVLFLAVRCTRQPFELAKAAPVAAVHLQHYKMAAVNYS